MKNIHVPREEETGPHYGHPRVYIGPRGIPAGRFWAVYVDDGGAHDRHTVRGWFDTEAGAENLAREYIERYCESDDEPFNRLSGTFHPPFSNLSGCENRRKSLQTKGNFNHLS